MHSLLSVDCRPPWLVARLPAPFRIAGWALNRPGFARADTVAWLEVRNADLPLGVDPLALIETRLAAAGLGPAVGLMTARDVRRHHHRVSADGPARAEVLLTLGLTNGSVLDPSGRPSPPLGAVVAGTINLLAVLSEPLDDGAMIEAASVATLARTAALLAEGGQIAGTGTDCVVVACPPSATPHRHAGLHTAIGRALSAAVFQATRAARQEWEAENAPLLARLRGHPSPLPEGTSP